MRKLISLVMAGVVVPVALQAQKPTDETSSSTRREAGGDLHGEARCTGPGNTGHRRNGRSRHDTRSGGCRARPALLE